ncbi:MAG: L-aspartate oxidase [Mariprofundaceae bacterium]|nr:L-aspartate oxidase [Mariprofundaceae bacterium]
MNTSLALHCDYLIIGSGAAGLLAAQHLAEHGAVILINKGEFSDSNTYYAQGGIAGVADTSDSTENHIQDTLIAGAGLCHENTVRKVAEAGGAMVRHLQALGTPFDHDEQGLHLTKEGGHSHRRVAHVQDATGRAISETLYHHVQNDQRISCLSQHIAIDLITSRRLGRHHGHNRCLGAYLLNPEGVIITVAAKATVLATGGAGKVYRYTSNPHVATGDGIAMAWRAGCAVMNMEFIQFHPTCLFHATAPTMLLSEALRGEGAHIVDEQGHRFVFNYDPRGEMASRDIVARAIDHEMKKQGKDCMYLDARPLGVKKILRHFPNIHQRLLDVSIDMRQSPIPIVPAAHYICGGVQTDLAGRTSVNGLYVIGESACTGLHGANRLASNSLLECMVMADACCHHVKNEPVPPFHMHLPCWDDSGTMPEMDRVQIKQNWDEIRATMSNYVGIVRSRHLLRNARRRLALIREEISSYYWQHPLSRDLIELRNLCLIAELIVRSAQQRKESRGLHYSTDFPNTNSKEVHDTIIKPEVL